MNSNCKCGNEAYESSRSYLAHCDSGERLQCAECGGTMTASELIGTLTEIVKSDGDLPVVFGYGSPLRAVKVGNAIELWDITDDDETRLKKLGKERREAEDRSDAEFAAWLEQFQSLEPTQSDVEGAAKFPLFTAEQCMLRRLRREWEAIAKSSE